MKNINFIFFQSVINLIIKPIAVLYTFFKKCNQLNIYNVYRRKYDIHDSFIFNGCDIIFQGNGEINIGAHSYIGRYSSLNASENTKISIGKNCKIGPCFNIWTQSSYVNHDFNFDNTIIPKIGNITIKDAVWIGANVVISTSITVGENSIIGANSVVTKDVPPFSIVGGVPARIISYKNVGKFK